MIKHSRNDLKDKSYNKKVLEIQSLTLFQIKMEQTGHYVWSGLWKKNIPKS